jgi:succinoglycan biosynthesis transport protein ExoP
LNTRPHKFSDAVNPPGGGGPRRPGAASRSPRPETFDFWRATHRALRGRYRLALLIAASGAAIGASAGAMLGQRLYAATGLVRVASALPQVMRETDQNRPLPMFDGFIQAQREVMLSREVVEAARREEPWQQVSRTHRTPPEERFAANLKVETRPRSDHLQVTFTDQDPAVAAAAVQSIVAAYQTAFTRDQDRAEGQRMAQLNARRANLSAELEQLEADMAPLAQGRTAAELEPLYATAAERLKKLRGALADVQCTLAGGPEIGMRAGGAPATPGQIVDDELLRSYASDQARAESQLEEARSRGYTPVNPVVVRLEASALAYRERAARFAADCEARRTARGGADPSPMSLGEREDKLRILTRTAEDEVKLLSAQRTQLAALEDRAAVVRQSLHETDSRVDALLTEASLGSRLTVIRCGDKPMTALRDNRAKAAASGALAGMAAPVGLLILAATLRRRYRFSDALAADLVGRVPFVAVVPDVAHGGAMDSVAARCVHDLRVRLQPPPGSGPRTYVVTSTSPGAGKSSLSVALGLSFAAAGFRTLLIDADLASRRLTHGFGAADKPGMADAVTGSEPQIQRLRSGLFILAAGSGGPDDGCRLAPAGTGRVLTDLRCSFDVVLIDADPILTGITASVLAPQADGVLLTLARGEQQPLVHSAIKHLEMLGASLSGAVFNRAAAADFKAVQPDQAGASVAGAAPVPEQLHRFGPLVAAVLRSLSLLGEDELKTVPAGLVLNRPQAARKSAA